MRCTPPSSPGGIRWNHHWINLSSACIGQHVGFEEIDNGIWDIFLGVLKLGRFYEELMKIEDLHPKPKRS
jgi:putative transposase